MGAAIVSVIKLPLSTIIIALLIAQAGLAAGTRIIVAVVIAYIAVQVLSARFVSVAGVSAPTPVAAAVPSDGQLAPPVTPIRPQP